MQPIDTGTTLSNQENTHTQGLDNVYATYSNHSGQSDTKLNVYPETLRGAVPLASTSRLKAANAAKAERGGASYGA